MSAEMTSSVVAAKPGKVATQVFSGETLKVIVPYAIIILAQAPLLFLYYRNLWQRPYYESFFLSLIALAFFLYMLWPRASQPFFKSRLSVVLLAVGLFFAVLATIFVVPWFAMFSAICLLGSLLSRTRNEETGRSLLPLILLPLVFLQPPIGLDFETAHGDQRLVTTLQTQSSIISSNVLDLLGYKHNLMGNVIEIPNDAAPGGVKPYHVEEACSGVQSFFTLLFLTTVFIIFAKRPWFRALLLLLSAMFWAVLMNTIRIVVIPIADIQFGWDLSSGLSHQILGYVALAIGALLVLSTDQFLMFLFGPVERAGADEEHGLRRRMIEFWNRVISGSPEGHRNPKPISPVFLVALWPIAGFMALIGVVQTFDVMRTLSLPDVAVRFYDWDPTMRLTDENSPDVIDTGEFVWQKEGYAFENRSPGSDLGQRSDTWAYMVFRRDESGSMAPLLRQVVVSLDQPFPGWHELTTCYYSDGWELAPDGRRRVHWVDDETGMAWPYIEVDFFKPTGERGFLVFSLFDRTGEVFDAPGQWGDLNSLLLRIQNRLSHRIRARLFHGEGYQLQVFVSGPRELTETQREAVVTNYLAWREHLRQQFETGQVQPVGDSRPVEESPAPTSVETSASTDSEL